jgi:hypothetical protein
VLLKKIALVVALALLGLIYLGWLPKRRARSFVRFMLGSVGGWAPGCCRLERQDSAVRGKTLNKILLMFGAKKHRVVGRSDDSSCLK